MLGFGIVLAGIITTSDGRPNISPAGDDIAWGLGGLTPRALQQKILKKIINTLPNGIDIQIRFARVLTGMRGWDKAKDVDFIKVLRPSGLLPQIEDDRFQLELALRKMFKHFVLQRTPQAEQSFGDLLLLLDPHPRDKRKLGRMRAKSYVPKAASRSGRRPKEEFDSIISKMLDYLSNYELKKVISCLVDLVLGHMTSVSISSCAGPPESSKRRVNSNQVTPGSGAYVGLISKLERNE